MQTASSTSTSTHIHHKNINQIIKTHQTNNTSSHNYHHILSHLTQHPLTSHPKTHTIKATTSTSTQHSQTPTLIQQHIHINSITYQHFSLQVAIKTSLNSQINTTKYPQHTGAPQSSTPHCTHSFTPPHSNSQVTFNYATTQHPHHTSSQAKLWPGAVVITNQSTPNHTTHPPPITHSPKSNIKSSNPSSQVYAHTHNRPTNISPPNITSSSPRKAHSFTSHTGGKTLNQHPTNNKSHMQFTTIITKFTHHHSPNPTPPLPQKVISFNRQVIIKASTTISHHHNITSINTGNYPNPRRWGVGGPPEGPVTPSPSQPHHLQSQTNIIIQTNQQSNHFIINIINKIQQSTNIHNHCITQSSHQNIPYHLTSSTSSFHHHLTDHQTFFQPSHQTLPPSPITLISRHSATTTTTPECVSRGAPSSQHHSHMRLCRDPPQHTHSITHTTHPTIIANTNLPPLTTSTPPPHHPPSLKTLPLPRIIRKTVTEHRHKDFPGSSKSRSIDLNTYRHNHHSATIIITTTPRGSHKFINKHTPSHHHITSNKTFTPTNPHHSITPSSHQSSTPPHLISIEVRIQQCQSTPQESPISSVRVHSQSFIITHTSIKNQYHHSPQHIIISTHIINHQSILHPLHKNTKNQKIINQTIHTRQIPKCMITFIKKVNNRQKWPNSRGSVKNSSVNKTNKYKKKAKIQHKKDNTKHQSQLTYTPQTTPTSTSKHSTAPPTPSGPFPITGKISTNTTSFISNHINST